MWMQDHSRRNVLPQPGMRHCKRHRLSHCRMLHEHIVHFLRHNCYPATVDNLLHAARDKKVTAGIHIPLVTRSKPTMSEGAPVGRGIVVVALYDGCATYNDLTSFIH